MINLYPSTLNTVENVIYLLYGKYIDFYIDQSFIYFNIYKKKTTNACLSLICIFNAQVTYG